MTTAKFSRNGKTLWKRDNLSRTEVSGFCLAVLFFVILWITLPPFVITWAWGLFAPVFGLSTLTYWPAFGIWLLLNIIANILRGGSSK